VSAFLSCCRSGRITKSEADFGNVLLQLFAHMGDILSYYQDRIAGESFLTTAQSRHSVIQHLRLIGYRLATAAPASATLVLSVPAAVNDTLTIIQGNAFATRSERDRPSVRFEYTSTTPLEINCAALPIINGRKYFGPIPIEEGRLVQNERLGVSTGQANQRFPLARSPLILRPFDQEQGENTDVTLIVRYAGTIEQWSLRETLAFSRGGQRDFTVDIDEHDRATIVFGDGRFGAIPPKSAQLQVSYRVGGGRAGNVAANTISTIVDAPELTLVTAAVTNPAPATGGDERETITHAVRQAPRVFRSLKRAVTENDYKALALNYQGVGKVRAEAGSWNTVTLYVAPAGGGEVSDVLKAGLLAYFEDKRPITTRIDIAGVDYVDIIVEVMIEIESFYERAAVQAQAAAAIADLLAFDNVDFAQVIYLSKFYEAIEAINGIRSVFISRFERVDKTVAGSEQGRIGLGPNEIPRLAPTGSTIRIRGEA
jgi:alpha/beta superfamily hydrolase